MLWCSAYQTSALDTMFPQPCWCSLLCVWFTTVDQQPIDSHSVILWMDVSLMSWSVINHRHSTSYLVHTKTWWPVGRKSTRIQRISSVRCMGARSLRESAWTFRGRWWQLEESKDVLDKVCQHRTALGDVDGATYQHDSCNGIILIGQLNGDKLAGALSLKEGWMWQTWTCI